MIRLRSGEGGRDGNSLARRQSNLGPISARLGWCCKSGQQEWAGAQKEGETWTSGGVSEAAERPPLVPYFRGRGPHLSAESVRGEKGGRDRPRALLGPQHSEKVPTPRSPFPSPAAEIPTSGFRCRTVGSGSKTSKPRPRPGSPREVRGGLLQREAEAASLARPAGRSPVISTICYFLGRRDPPFPLSRGRQYPVSTRWAAPAPPGEEPRRGRPTELV